jgi:hypothetical protein
MENNEDGSRRRVMLRKVFAGYLPFTALAIATAIAIVGLSKSWAAVLAGGVILLIWSALIALSQLLILFLKVDSRFYLKCVAVTVFSMFGAPFAVGGINKVFVAIFIGKPDLERFLREGSPKRCEVLEMKDERRVGRRSYYVAAIVSCEPDNDKQYCVWWFHKADAWTVSSSLNQRCPIATRLPAEGWRVSSVSVVSSSTTTTWAAGFIAL